VRRRSEEKCGGGVRRSEEEKCGEMRRSNDVTINILHNYMQ
jgi:hypothetical protein